MGIAEQVRERVGDSIPLMIFARGAPYANAMLVNIPQYDVFTIDGSIDRSSIRQELPNDVVLQGNFDPKELIEDNDKNVDTVRQSAIEYLKDIGPSKLIANLGEGLSGRESPKLVNEFINAVTEESQKMLTK